jgi:creatinine amidohydrolase
MKRRFWNELTSADFQDLDPEQTIAVLPVAAVEQHGPHLPVGTDTIIAEGMIEETLKHLPEELNIFFLPIQAVGKSNEHVKWPGTITLTAETALKAWAEIGESVARAGVRKIILVNSHGGNSELLGILSRELRVRFGMLAVHTHWMRFGYPAGLFDAQEMAHGIHAGDIETSLMLHFRPDLVRRESAANFIPDSIGMTRQFQYLGPSAPHALAWMAQDLNGSGAMGDASKATPEKGAATAAHQALGFSALLGEVASFRLERLAP